MSDRLFWICAMAGIACLVGLSATGCIQPPPPAHEPNRIAAPPQDPGSDPAAHPEITAVWRGFWSRSWRLDQAPQPQWRPKLSDLTDDQLTDQLLQRKAHDLALGVRLYGQVQSHVATAQVRGDRAIVTDCQDTSESGKASLSGRPMTVGTAGNRVLGRLRLTSAGWRVSRVDYLGGGC